MQLISCNKLTMQYDKQVAVENVTFTVDEGDFFCIVGENGTGKSTLMKGLLGLLRPVKGEIRFEHIKPNEIGYLPQQTQIQRDFPASVLEVVVSGCLSRRGFRPFYTKEEKQRAQSNLKRLQMEALASHSYRELSGGQQQRVLLARALCATSKLLLLDEPVAGLDPVVTSQMYRLIRQLNQEDGITVIMVSHDIPNALKYGTKILHMNTKPLFYGSTADYQNTPVYRRIAGGEHFD